ncbi:M20 aminoacylase family protein [Pantoea ananatis]|uniref:M20 aminoacylase family protein n=1 Tax=Pantoea ananas TaxID=553 RepID=UPI001B317690|nr:M20 aminoacylase family protein [Pantoea ananatis]
MYVKSLIETLDENVSEFVDLRRNIHKHPELGFKEQSTSELVATKLKEWGYTVHCGLAKTGVVGTLRSGTGNKVIALRADMDALPIFEQSGKPWSSLEHGVFHGCGHDGHTVMLLCAAKYLAHTRRFNGVLHVIFQPAEETLSGGRRMIDDGLFKLFPCDKIFGLHNVPGLKTGHFYCRSGSLMASSDTIHIKITGIGAHGAMPEKGIDATLVACHIGVALQSIVSRNVDPVEAAVITIGCIESGEAANVVNASALMKLSVRSIHKDTRELLVSRIQDLAMAQADSFGAKAEVEIVNSSPVLVNGSEATEFAMKIASDLVGKDKLHLASPAMGSEDFAFMLEAHPDGCYMLVGGGDAPGYCNLHNPGYDFNDEIISTGAAYWVSLVETYLIS